MGDNGNEKRGTKMENGRKIGKKKEGMTRNKKNASFHVSKLKEKFVGIFAPPPPKIILQDVLPMCK